MRSRTRCFCTHCDGRSRAAGRHAARSASVQIESVTATMAVVYPAFIVTVEDVVDVTVGRGPGASKHGERAPPIQTR